MSGLRADQFFCIASSMDGRDGSLPFPATSRGSGGRREPNEENGSAGVWIMSMIIGCVADIPVARLDRPVEGFDPTSALGMSEPHL
jgi:hypothetical protein